MKPPSPKPMVIKSVEYVLQHLDDIKIAYYQNKVFLGTQTNGNLTLFFPEDSSPAQVPPHMIRCIATSHDNDGQTERTACNVVLYDPSIPGQYTVSYIPMHRGTNELMIFIGDSDMVRYTVKSPISIPPSERGTPTNTFSNRLKYPYATEILRNGTILVTEYFSGRITFLNPQGKTIKSIGSRGERMGQFNHPTGIAITPKGTILVSDRDNHRIQELDLDGEWITCAGLPGNGELQFNRPEGIAISPTSGMVYVADCYNHRIQVLNPDLTYAYSIGRLGEEKGKFKHPFGLAFDSRGYLYVTDRCNDRIQRFTPDGEICNIVHCNIPGPTGITIDDQDILYICEYDIDLITALTTTGEFVPCELQGMCKGPYGIKFNRYNGDILVSDTRNNRILVF